ncbi:MAG: hypothetical protein AB8G05_18025 [Oligoflexales bacterium]
MKLLSILILFYSLSSSAYGGSDEAPNINPWKTSGHIEQEFQANQKKRRAFEKDHGLDHWVIKEYDEGLTSDPRQILLLPFNIRHLRQTLQFLFFVASEYDFARQRKPDPEAAFNWAIRTCDEINNIHPQAFSSPDIGERSKRTSEHGFLSLASQASQPETVKQIISNLAKNTHYSVNSYYFSLYKDTVQYQLLKFVREFFPDDTLGYNQARNTIGILDDGEHSNNSLSWVNGDYHAEEYGKGAGHYAPPSQNYLLGMDLNSRLVIDFNRIDSSIAIPIDAKMNDWQKDWPDSAGIRFFIANKAYDVYFPTKWSNYHVDLAPKSLGLSKLSQSFHGSVVVDKTNIVTTQDGIIYQPVLQNSAAERAVKSINYGYYPFQSPRIIKAFSTRPLHRIWSIGRSYGRGGSAQARVVAAHKDDCKEYKTFEEAVNTFDIMTRFEFLWDNRSSFYPEYHVSELRYFAKSRENVTIDNFFQHPDHSFSFFVPYSYIWSASDFIEELEKVDQISSGFVWDRSDYEAEHARKEKEEALIVPVQPQCEQEKNNSKKQRKRPNKGKNNNRFSRNFFGFGFGLGLIYFISFANSDQQNQT